MNGTTRASGSLYTVPVDAVGDDRIYGTFTRQRILGYACDIEVVCLADNDPIVLDLLGYALVQRGDSAMHMSGLDPYGKRTGPGFIRAIGRQSIRWDRQDIAEHPPSGLGSRHPDPGIIVSWDEDASGRGHRSDMWQHHVFYGAPTAFLTLRGVYQWWLYRGMSPFAVRDISATVDIGRQTYMQVSGDKQHEVAFRRLLEGHVGVSNNRLPRLQGQPVLRRVGRWEYTFTVGEMV